MIRFIPLLSSLLLGLLLPLSLAAASPTAPVAGTDYVLIDDGQPWQPAAGRIAAAKIEVVEVFGYWCSHCAQFQPLLEAWVRRLPADVRFSYVPAAFDPNDAFARGYFAALDLGAVARTHDAMFRAIHDDRVLPTNATIDEIAWFYGQQGLPPAKLKVAMTSPAADARMARAHEFEVHSGVEGTPTLIIDGRYRVLGRDHEDLLRNASALIVQLRAARR